MLLGVFLHTYCCITLGTCLNNASFQGLDLKETPVVCLVYLLTDDNLSNTVTSHRLKLSLSAQHRMSKQNVLSITHKTSLSGHWWWWKRGCEHWQGFGCAERNFLMLPHPFKPFSLFSSAYIFVFLSSYHYTNCSPICDWLFRTA